MAKATRKNSTKSKGQPREGLDLIDATHQRKNVKEPELKTFKRRFSACRAL
jgi:hypothetical protein